MAGVEALKKSFVKMNVETVTDCSLSTDALLTCRTLSKPTGQMPATRTKKETSQPECKILICTHCPFVTKWTSSLTRHIQTAHNISRVLGDVHLYPDCGKIFNSQASLYSHSAHHAVSKYMCKICGEYSQNKTQFQEHLNSHTGYREVCECGAKFVFPGDLTKHKKTCSETSNTPKYACKICSVKFKGSQGLHDHMKGKHDQQYTHTCLCGKAFLWRSSLKHHRDRCTFAQINNDHKYSSVSNDKNCPITFPPSL